MGLTIVTRDSIGPASQVRGSGKSTRSQSLSKSKNGSQPKSGGLMGSIRDTFSSSKSTGSTKSSNSNRTTPR